ncbi:MAG TPA: hypothetical protein DCY48_03665 [Candidatus Magasanikbacteria bacterium]|nr:MAG: hypothetical protein A3I74_04610 [Candidatus Magasanikbacteria bacterium RIFCSPLOWO2_02_FULL_47_16]OGH79487.1 MAG: hypothetical protein A3C10_01580 [Candidatus Magasanikbacteria bacterium RIFCSPHIGHO2_02_FULL_48_18]OGH83167.1 MAG: hypothetical protein A3G08_04580 [Candidatus Magasanikbacteria bacterium RIFCSPLOWO2_12_FULL_47_9b]HAZ28842.1 hypothetical protein [Candidatus Magasanikbacteria bacterium]
MYHSGDRLVDPHLIFEKIHLHPGMHAADFGCGRTGHIVFPLSKIIGDDGIIYAVDILQDVILDIQKTAATHHLHNIHTLWADIEKKGSVSIPEHSLDVVFLVNIVWTMSNMFAPLDEAVRLLRDKARIVIVDWKKPGPGFGPSLQQVVDFATVGQWAKRHGLVIQEQFDSGPYHHGIILFQQQ